MRENVSYAEMTCDLCGKKERINLSRTLPPGWGIIDLGDGRIDVCESCHRYIREAADKMILFREKGYMSDDYGKKYEYLEGMIAYEEACEHRLAGSGFSDAEQMDIQAVVLDKAEEDFRAGLEDLYKE